MAELLVLLVGAYVGISVLCTVVIYLSLSDHGYAGRVLRDMKNMGEITEEEVVEFHKAMDHKGSRLTASLCAGVIWPKCIYEGLKGD